MPSPSPGFAPEAGVAPAPSDVVSSSPSSTPAGAVTNYDPSPSLVASFIRSRTKLGAPYGGQATGFEYGDWTPTTRPTTAQVQDAIATVLPLVAVRFGATVPASVLVMMKSVAALAVAIQIELSYYPDQVANNKSPYAQLRDQYNDLVATVESAILESIEGDGPEAGTGDVGMPAYGGFPITAIGMEQNW